MGMTREQLEEEIDWVRSLVHNYYRDEETPILCHNDPHLGNMMIDENDKTGDSLVLIDFDNTKYGYRAFDFVYHFNYHSISKETNEWEPNGVTEFRGRVVLVH